MRRHFALRYMVLSCFLACGAGAALASERPNFLLFTADDLHAESLGVYGGRPVDLTPNLDAFATEAMRFTRAHVNAAICAPCRAIIATGRYSHRSGAMGFMKAREDVPDIVTTLQNGGYLAGILGKVGHSTPKNSMKWDYQFDQKELGNGRNPEIYYQRSKAFLEQSKKAGKPFYFMVNSHDPHRPYCNPDKLTRGAAMPSRTYQPSEVEVPGFLPDLPGVRAELAHYLNSTRRLDDTFGKVMQALQESGFADNTLVVFISDNGIAVPFAKCNAWFHSSRTPMLVRWPGTVRAGMTNDRDFVSTVDFFPTFLEVTAVKGPDGLDGRSFVSLIEGKPQDGREHVFTQIDSKAGGDSVPMRCVQNGHYGYIYNPFSDGKHWYRNNNEGKTMAAMQVAAKTDVEIAARIKLFRYRVPEELYDLQHDPDCLHNLIDRPNHQGTIDALQDQLVTHMKRTSDPMLKAFLNRTDRAAVDKVLL
ncbi:MAG: sulfatase-like hydrolase/transferase, partial [Pirellulaceae bacterium]|nr:sulfatase-like hydrolase/transferase [Pirellulaceae bacterium]